MSDPASEPDASTTARLAAQSAPVNSAQPMVKEVRLGLVCYGALAAQVAAIKPGAVPGPG